MFPLASTVTLASATPAFVTENCLPQGGMSEKGVSFVVASGSVVLETIPLANV